MARKLGRMVQQSSTEINSTQGEIKQTEQEEREEFEREAVIYRLNNFLQEVKRNREGHTISTGFENRKRRRTAPALPSRKAPSGIGPRRPDATFSPARPFCFSP